MKKIEKLNSEENIIIKLFGKEVEVGVFSTGDNCFDDEGDYKPDGFALSDEEIDYLNWFVQNIKIEDYTKQIAEYCNQCYDDIREDKIEEDNVKNEISIASIAINIGDNGDDYPDIAFYGGCECDPEHGICIGFRNKEFLGIESQDWIL